jgi:hypothetical protein
MNKLQLAIADLSTQFAQAVDRAVMASFANAVPTVEAPAAPAKREAAPAPEKPRAVAGRQAVRRGAAATRKPGRPAKAAAAPKVAPAPKAASRSGGAVLRASLPAAATLQLVEAIVGVLTNGPLYSEDLRRELNVSRRDLAKALAQGIASGKVIKTGERRKTIYQVG